ncbi:hypothetical protein AWRI1631_41160 [Saccharomyces cerevisiae AWRI1631]|uniref:Uncharacterized protein n=1 Tax=Saccharomyces cerevisiae (strain AWRI1631) TaxID=545124 RepID=B5VFE7_YEAS6|nr:hypothetical protein AWRI1631_41160 [Saccharomyces cerevisiae AWRI1631]
MSKVFVGQLQKSLPLLYKSFVSFIFLTIVLLQLFLFFSPFI